MIYQFKPGDLFHNRYRLEKLVGVGGFADVWKAQDIQTDTTIALKIYSRLDDDGINELSEEYKRMQCLNHPNLLRADHFDRWDNIPYLEMKFCSGGSLEKKIGKLTDIEAIAIIRDLSEGLRFLHQNGIIHQDIKPANVLVDEHGRYLLSDFGISSKTKSTLRKSVNMSQNTSMTEDYAPPEKFSPKSSDRVPDKKGDIFSLGISLYELITGHLPFDNLSTGRQLQYENIKLDFSDIRDTKIRKIVTWCMQRDKDKRPSASDIVNFLNNQHATSDIPGRKKEAKWQKKYVWILVILTLIISLITYINIEIQDKKMRQMRIEMEKYERTHGEEMGHEYVDLGLLSCTLWATCNVGASSPEENGDYYAWGEITPKSSYTASNSKTFGKQYDKISPEKRLDPARSNWGGQWRLPSKEEFEELIIKCTWTWTCLNGSNGYNVTGPNGNSIFIPAAGFICESSRHYVGKYGEYWSNLPTENYNKTAYHLFLCDDEVSVHSHIRYYGRSIRPVLDK